MAVRTTLGKPLYPQKMGIFSCVPAGRSSGGCTRKGALSSLSLHLCKVKGLWGQGGPKYCAKVSRNLQKEISCQINVPIPPSSLVLLAGFAEADLDARTMNQGVSALPYSPARGIGAGHWFQTRKTSGLNWDCPTCMEHPFLCADICSYP